LAETEAETALSSLKIQAFLLEKKFPVIPIIPTKDGNLSVRVKDREQEYKFILYDFIQGGEPPSESMEKAGALVGKLHRTMQDYPGSLPVRDKAYFIDRYVGVMKSVRYAKWEAFGTLGAEMWDKVSRLPRGFCHCDLYDGNVHATDSGDMVIVDFDTSCRAFPGYDVILFCNRTHYFEYDDGGYEKTKVRLDRFLPGYLRYHTLSGDELSALPVLLGIYHYQLQAVILERNGYDAGIVRFFDKQYDWLLRWKEQCMRMGTW
jgi:Ser/Thr protein kinase RdoA (MazF antagonist)